MRDRLRGRLVAVVDMLGATLDRLGVRDNDRFMVVSQKKKPRRSQMPAPPIAIHHIWVGGPFVPTDAQAAAMASWREAFPDVPVRVWLDDDADRLLARYPRVRRVYDALSAPVAKADVLRYVVLHAHGGLYADLDYACLRRFRLPDAPAVVEANWLGAADQAGAVNNGLLSAPAPGEPFWASVLDALTAPPRRKRLAQRLSRTVDVIETTGPRFLRRAVDDFRAAGGRVHVLPRRLFNPCDDLCAVCGDLDGAYARHASAFSWGGARMRRFKARACRAYPAAAAAYPAAVSAAAAASPARVAAAAALVLVAVVWAARQLKSPGRSTWQM